MTQRLVALASHYWASMDGLLASQSVDPLDLPPDRFLSVVYWWALRNADDQREIAKFDRRLWRPPPGIAPAAGSPWSPEAENEAFGAFAASVGMGEVADGK